MKNIKYIFSLLLLTTTVNQILFANSAPQISNVTAHQRTDGNGIVDIFYTLSDVDNDKCTITVKVSNDGGSSWTITPSASALHGDLTNVSPGRKHITWASRTDLPGVFGTNYRIKLVVNDDLNNIASESDLYFKLVDGEKNCACVNDASFGPGWNPGEIIEANFSTKKRLDEMALYLGCSAAHGETGSGFIEAKIDNTYQAIAFFYSYGYVTNKFRIYFAQSVYTDSIRAHLTGGGGPDNNLCISEIEIFGE